MRAWFAVMAAAAGVGCASAPMSRVEGVPRTRTDPSLYPVRVVSVDGQIHFGKMGEAVLLEPGPRMLVLEAAPARAARTGAQRTFAFKVDPCTHYFFAARRASPMAEDWTLVVDHKEVVARCDPKVEAAKAAR